MKLGIQQISKGLNTDYSLINQPKSTYRFALNALLESSEGDFMQLSNENGNKLSFSLKEGFLCIGTVYIDDDETVIFSVNKPLNSNEKAISEIGIFNSKDNSYRVWCNDSSSPDKNKLNFDTLHHIQALYRLRRGCEKTIYWTDNLNPIRTANLSYPQNYKTQSNNKTYFDADKFTLSKKFNSVPLLKDIKIVEGGGELPNGSLTILLQYLDVNKNGTKWISEIPNINIYSDRTDNEYSEIDGDINNKDVKEFNNKHSSKAVSLTYNNFDPKYEFCRLAFVHYYSNTKQPTACYLSDVLPIINGEVSFTYTGSNFLEKTTYEEVLLFNKTNPFKTAKTILQTDNRLIAGNVAGDDTNWGLLQKYASKIAVDCVTKKVKINDATNKHNAKNPFVKLYGSSCMPGEVYSLAINYVFEDLTESPSYHIPGKNFNTPHKTFAKVTDSDCNLHPMTYEAIFDHYITMGNHNLNLKYTQRENCNNFDLWGVDCEGNKLKNTPVRFHRLPTRKQLDLPLVDENNFTYIFGFQFSNIEIPNEKLLGKKCIGYYFTKQEIKKDDRTVLDSGYLIDTMRFKNMVGTSAPYSYWGEQKYKAPSTEFPNISNEVKMILAPMNKFTGETYDAVTDIIEANRFKTSKQTKSGFLIQNVTDDKSEDRDKEHNVTKQNDGADLKSIIRDIELEPYNEHNYKTHKTGIVKLKKDNIRLYYLQPYEKADYRKDNISIYNLDGMSANLYVYSKSTNTNPEPFGRIENLKSDTNVDNITGNGNKTIPFVYFIRNHNSYYSNFLYNPYYRITQTFDSSYNNICISFDGDNYIGGYRHTMSSYCNTAPKQPILDDSRTFWKALLVAVLAVVVTVLTYGTALAIIGGILLAAGSVFYGLRAKVAAEKFNELYKVDWNSGIKFLFQDDFYWNSFMKPSSVTDNRQELGYQDDTMRYYNHIIGDFIFESPINFTLRVEPNDDDDNYLRPFTEHLPVSAEVKIRPLVTDWFDYSGTGGSMELRKSINKVFTLKGIKLWQSYFMGCPIEHKEEKFFLSRLCEIDQSRYKSEYRIDEVTMPAIGLNNNKEVIWEMISGYKAYGSAKPIFYCINQDYLVQNKVEKYFALPFEYSFCSECKEKFPHRFYWTDVSFSEQLIDNYSIFKANNYKDIDGEFGEIVNLFSFNNQLFIHTKNGLWLQPTNYQERVTDGIVSYIGTGEFGSLPARLIVDSKTGNSAGLTNRDSQIITPLGYFFVCESDRKVYWFNGQLNSISDLGMSDWFKNNITSTKEELAATYILNYDYRNERLLVTKRSSETKFDIYGRYNIDISSWTISFNLKTKSWISFHSYIPNNYLQSKDSMYTFNYGQLYKHTQTNKEGNLISKPQYQVFYEEKYPYIVEYVSNDNPTVTKIFDHIRIVTEAFKFDENTKSFVEERYKTFNKALIYNSRQCTGIIDLRVKDLSQQQEYLLTQIENTNNNSFIIDRNEKDWLLNDIRDMVTNYNVPMFNENYSSVTNGEFYSKNADKIINEKAFEGEKDWYDLESLRDKYLVVRLIFDNFADVKLILNFTEENGSLSEY